jgi:2-polyprenyl-6-methoxyphenol hydroxylase-like FAD-dependent oxidoreductase
VERIADRAIVVGAGIGGLAAAAAVAPRFSRVTLLDRDRLPSHPEPRLGVPHCRHVHGLLGGGLDALQSLFPGIVDRLLAAGAVPVRVGVDVRVEQPGYDPFPQRDLGRTSYSMSRPLLEHVVREFVANDDRIEIRPRCRVREIVPSADGRHASAVRCDVDGQASETLPADLIVDASGRGAPTLDFLAKAGYPAPQESSVPIDVRYSCAVFALAKDEARDWKVLQTRPDPAVNGRRAIMFPLEGGEHWLLGLGGVNGDSAPADPGGFLQYASTLRTPTAFNAIRNAAIQGEIQRFAFPRSSRRHFERMPAFPQGLLPIGDSICRINPSYGQGMSVAAKEAVLLGQVLRNASADWQSALAPSYFALLGDVLDDPWAVACQDFVYPHLQDARPAGFEEKMKFQAALNRLAAADPSIHALTMEVLHLMQPARALHSGEIAERIAMEIRAA